MFQINKIPDPTKKLNYPKFWFSSGKASILGTNMT
jgi:hypothetical protein